MQISLTNNAPAALAERKERAALAMDAAGRLLAAAVKAKLTENGQVRTGFLRASVGYEAREDAVTVGAGAPYAKFVELGHRVVRRGKTVGYVPPAPFLRPAVEAAADALAALTAAALCGEQAEPGTGEG